jgi:hypothetical protein
VTSEGYRNHVHRMLNFCCALHNSVEKERQKLTIAGCFHDIGIWTGHTFDYLPPSVLAAKEYLELDGLGAWTSEVALMIDQHHEFRSYLDARSRWSRFTGRATLSISRWEWSRAACRATSSAP